MNDGDGRAGGLGAVRADEDGHRWAAPGRVNLIGEHVDYAEGLCLPFAIAERTVVTAGRRDDDRLVVRSDAADHERPDDVEIEISEIGPGVPEGWSGYVAGVLWALRQAGHTVGGLTVSVTDTVPLGAGLSSSAALECAVALAVNDLYALDLPRVELARACMRAENDVVGAATGGMDQLASMFGEEGHALLVDMRAEAGADGGRRLVPFALDDAGLRLLVIDTRVRHHLADGQYGQRRAAVEKAADELGLASLRDATPQDLTRLDGELQRRARHVVTEIERVREVVDALDAGRPQDIGPQLDASHRSLARDYEVSCHELDLACEAARYAGALGARMTGGGFGGSVIALVPVDRTEAVRRTVTETFSELGLRVPTIRAANPSAGATRLP